VFCFNGTLVHCLFAQQTTNNTSTHTNNKNKQRIVGALKALDKAEKAAEDEGKPARRAAAEQRAALLARLGWQHWSEYELARARVPAAYPPF
jgi:hypothetical protein